MTYYYMAVAKFQFRYKLRMSFLRTIIAGLLNRQFFLSNHIWGLGSTRTYGYVKTVLPV